ncbi:MAG TPA: PDZ domain-containing protein, partial [Pyrinomonadaceae bacterium]|nr:PDZ domain-containing protein [Pyrinomonadaceae bacterium]
RRYVRGVEVPPYEEALAGVGLRLIRAPASEPYRAGLSLNSQTMRITGVRNNSAAEDAGLQQGDVLLSIGNQKVTGENWVAALNRYKQNQQVSLTVQRDRNVIKASITLGEPDHYDYRVEENRDASAETRALRAAWMNG